jgi:hypothetical protein
MWPFQLFRVNISTIRPFTQTSARGQFEYKESKQFKNKLDQISVAIFYLVVYIVKKYFWNQFSLEHTWISQIKFPLVHIDVENV